MSQIQEYSSKFCNGWSYLNCHVPIVTYAAVEVSELINHLEFLCNKGQGTIKWLVVLQHNFAPWRCEAHVKWWNYSREGIQGWLRYRSIVKYRVSMVRNNGDQSVFQYGAPQRLHCKIPQVVESMVADALIHYMGKHSTKAPERQGLR